MANNAAVLLPYTREVPRRIHKGNQRDIKAVAEADKARGFVRSVDV